MHILVTSRPYLTDFKSAFDSGFATKLEIRASDADVQLYLLAEIDQSEDLQEMLADHQSYKDEIISTIVEKADGQFLLPSLHIARLAEMTNLREVKNALADMASSLEETYEVALGRIQSRPRERKELAMDCLMWLSHVLEPFKFDHLQKVLAIRPELGSDKLEIDSFPARRVVLESCLGLVAIEEQSDQVRLAHFTLEEYLRRQNRLFNDSNLRIARVLVSLLISEDGTWYTEAMRSLFSSDKASLPVERHYTEPDIGLDAFHKQLEDTSKEGSFGKRPLFLLNYAFERWRTHALSAAVDVDSTFCKYLSSRPGCVRFGTDFLVTFALDSELLNCPGWVELLYAVLNGAPSWARSIMKLHGTGVLRKHFPSKEEPTLLSCVSQVFQFEGVFSTWYSKPWVRQKLDEIMELVCEDGSFLTNCHPIDQENLAYLLPRCSRSTMEFMIDKGLHVDQRFELLLPLLGTNLDHFDFSEGHSLLHWVVVCSSRDAVRLLLERGALRLCPACGIDVTIDAPSRVPHSLKTADIHSRGETHQPELID